MKNLLSYLLLFFQIFSNCSHEAGTSSDSDNSGFPIRFSLQQKEFKPSIPYTPRSHMDKSSIYNDICMYQLLLNLLPKYRDNKLLNNPGNPQESIMFILSKACRVNDVLNLGHNTSDFIKWAMLAEKYKLVSTLLLCAKENKEPVMRVDIVDLFKFMIKQLSDRPVSRPADVLQNVEFILQSAFDKSINGLTISNHKAWDIFNYILTIKNQDLRRSMLIKCIFEYGHHVYLTKGLANILRQCENIVISDLKTGNMELAKLFGISLVEYPETVDRLRQIQYDNVGIFIDQLLAEKDRLAQQSSDFDSTISYSTRPEDCSPNALFCRAKNCDLAGVLSTLRYALYSHRIVDDVGHNIAHHAARSECCANLKIGMLDWLISNFQELFEKSGNNKLSPLEFALARKLIPNRWTTTTLGYFLGKSLPEEETMRQVIMARIKKSDELTAKDLQKLVCEIIEYFLSKDIRPKFDPNFSASVFWAISIEERDLALKLLSLNADTSIYCFTQKNTRNLLSIAARRLDYELVQILAKKEDLVLNERSLAFILDFSCKIYDANTIEKIIAILSIILEAGANPNVFIGQMPLIHALISFKDDVLSEKILRLLLKHKASPYLKHKGYDQTFKDSCVVLKKSHLLTTLADSGYYDQSETASEQQSKSKRDSKRLRKIAGARAAQAH